MICLGIGKAGRSHHRSSPSEAELQPSGSVARCCRLLHRSARFVTPCECRANLRLDLVGRLVSYIDEWALLHCEGIALPLTFHLNPTSAPPSSLYGQMKKVFLNRLLTQSEIMTGNRSVLVIGTACAWSRGHR